MKSNFASAFMLVLLLGSGSSQGEGTTKAGESGCSPQTSQVTKSDTERTTLIKTFHWELISGEGANSSSGTTGNGTSVNGNIGVGSSGPTGGVGGNYSENSSDSSSGSTTGNYGWAPDGESTNTVGTPKAPICPEPRLVANVSNPIYQGTTETTTRIPAGYYVFIMTKTSRPWSRTHDCNCPAD